MNLIAHFEMASKNTAELKGLYCESQDQILNREF